MTDVTFYEVFSEEESRIRELLPKEISAEFFPQTIQASGHEKNRARLISIRTQSTIPLTWATDLRGIFTRSVGYDHLVQYFRRASVDIPCGYLVNYCSRAVAEHVLLVSLALLRKLNRQQRQFDHFDRENITGQNCLNKNMLVIGVGNIGGEVVRLARGMGMSVKGVDIDPKTKDVEYVSLEEGIAWADVIVLSVPLTSQTEGMISHPLLQKAKRGAVLVNVSRGEITPAEDLKKALSKKQLAGASLDVFPNEGMLAEFLRGNSQTITPNTKAVLELRAFDNVIFTPHNAFNTAESVEAKALQTVEAIQAFLSQGRFPHAVPAKT